MPFYCCDASFFAANCGVEVTQTKKMGHKGPFYSLFLAEKASYPELQAAISQIVLAGGCKKGELVRRIVKKDSNLMIKARFFDETQ